MELQMKLKLGDTRLLAVEAVKPQPMKGQVASLI